MPRIPSVDEKTVDAIIREALREEQDEPVLTGELPSDATVAKLGKLELEDAAGGSVRLGALWEASPAALVFLRHYG